MNHRPITPTQLQFCRQVSLGKNYTQAYLAAFKCSKKTAESNGYLMAKRPHLQQKIKEFREINGTLSEETKLLVQPGSEQDILERKDRLKLLTEIATGKQQRKKPMVVNGVVEYVDMPVPYTDSLKAIAELNRMDTDELSKQPFKPILRNVIINPVSNCKCKVEKNNSLLPASEKLPELND